MLLLQVALADPATARDAWERWNARQNLADAPGPQVRLLAAVGRRMAELFPDAPTDARLTGARRHIWTLTQMTLGTTRPLLAAMQAAGLRLALLKGAARLALDPEVAKERALQDIDVLIHPDDWDRGIDVALREGWTAWGGAQDRTLLASRHAIGLASPQPGAKGSFDLHRFAVKECLNRDQDVDLWRRVRTASLQGIAVTVPSITDLALVTLSQAMYYNRTPHPPHWALDVDPAIRAGQVDWDLLLHEVEARRIQHFVAAPLLMLQECLQSPVPPDVLSRLTRPLGKAYRIEFETRATSYETGGREVIEAVRIAAAARAMRAARHQRQGGRPGAKPPVLRYAALAPGVRVEIPVPGGAPFDRLRLEIAFRVQRAGKRAYLRLDAPGLPLKVVPVPRSGVLKRWIGHTATLHCPACLFDLRGIDAIRLRTSKRLSLRDVVVRWGPPEKKGLAARMLAAIGGQ